MMGGTGSGIRGHRKRSEQFRPAYAPPLHRPPETRPAPKPLEYLLVDLLGADGISETEIEAVRVVLFFAARARAADEANAREAKRAREMVRGDIYYGPTAGLCRAVALHKANTAQRTEAQRAEAALDAPSPKPAPEAEASDVVEQEVG
jgi:hypothetical protein